MKSTLVLPLLLSGCASEVSQYQLVLDQYAQSASNGHLQTTLTGSALRQAMESQKLLVELGWQQLGSSSFTETRISGANQVVSCLDVSSVQFFDSQGEEVTIDRPIQKLLMQVDFTPSTPKLISQIQEVGRC